MIFRTGLKCWSNWAILTNEKDGVINSFLKYRQVILHVNPGEVKQSLFKIHLQYGFVYVKSCTFYSFFVALESGRLFSLGCNPSTACHALFIDCPKTACQKIWCQYTHAFLHYLPQNRHAFLHYCLKTDMTFHRHDFLHNCPITVQPLGPHFSKLLWWYWKSNFFGV